MEVLFTSLTLIFTHLPTFFKGTFMNCQRVRTLKCGLCLSLMLERLFSPSYVKLLS